MNTKKFTQTSNNRKLLVAIHTKPNHADEVFAIAALKILNPNFDIVRTRDPDVFNKADFRIDVGGKYDPSTGDFDHHQGEFNERHPSPAHQDNEAQKAKYPTGPKYSGFGLIWLNYGKKIISQFLTRKCAIDYSVTDIPQKCMEYIDKQINRSLIAPIDAIDNGESREYWMDTGVYKTPSISKFIQMLNPSWLYETNENTDLLAFNSMIELAENYLACELLRAYGSWKAQSIILEKVKDIKDGILILEKYLPWMSVFAEYPEQTTNVKMVIYPSFDGYNVQSPYFNYRHDISIYSPTLPNGEKRRLRCSAPKNICGKVNKELQEITNIQDAAFVHSGGFIGAARSLEGAILLATYIVNNCE